MYVYVDIAYKDILLPSGIKQVMEALAEVYTHKHTRTDITHTHTHTHTDTHTHTHTHTDKTH